MHHALRSARGAGGVHDEERMAERKLLELQLGQLIQLVAARRQEVVDEDAEEAEDDCQAKNMIKTCVFAVQDRFQLVHMGDLDHNAAPVGDFGEVGLLFGASVRNNHHFLQVWKACADKRKKSCIRFLANITHKKIFQQKKE